MLHFRTLPIRNLTELRRSWLVQLLDDRLRWSLQQYISWLFWMLQSFLQLAKLLILNIYLAINQTPNHSKQYHSYQPRTLHWSLYKYLFLVFAWICRHCKITWVNYRLIFKHKYLVDLSLRSWVGSRRCGLFYRYFTYLQWQKCEGRVQTTLAL